ncbi:MerR family transcriptional regulator [Wukongibacter baidiensis]|uniref:MerR family transcriptional regulator n=1 Tax=Wukongibacter baidiensis TaxID=1723361 RepID=UPI003D7F532D
MNLKVKEVADMVGISVRTLHHYDQIGLLKPTSVTSSGYRLYSDSSLERLQQILFFKELDFNLKEIKQILDSPNFDRNQTLKSHRAFLMKKKVRLEKIIDMVEKSIESIERGIEMNKKDMFKAFDMSDIEKHKKKYAKEVREKYGEKVAEECERKTSSYREKDWEQIQSTSDEIYRKLAELMDVAPENQDVQQLIGEFRQFITKYFYDCTLEVFRGLGDLYVSDERFTAFYEKYRPGLAAFVRDAINIYCDNCKK